MSKMQIETKRIANLLREVNSLREINKDYESVIDSCNNKIYRLENLVNSYRIAEKQLKDKLHRRNLQIKDLKEQVKVENKQLKENGFSHLTMNQLTSNAIDFLKGQGYEVKAKV